MSCADSAAAGGEFGALKQIVRHYGRHVILDELETLLQSRRTADPEQSYTAQLLADPELTTRKIMEEAFEVCLELGRAETAPDLVAEEAADLIYHLLVGLVGVDVSLNDVFAVLEGRRS